MHQETDRTQWAPRTDVYTRDGTIVFRMDLPGVDQENVSVDVDDGQLTISGRRMRETSKDSGDGVTEDRTYHRVERFEGSFERGYLLPDSVDTDAITAHYEVPLPETSQGKDEKHTIDID
ncbi:MAG: Hsp20/alpha crystallin family protein [bacterium]